MAKRFLLMTKQADHEPDGYKQFVYPYQPVLALKPNVREVTEEEAKVIMSGGKLPVAVPPQGLKPGYMMMQVPQILANRINDLINDWENSQTMELPATANFQKVEMTPEKVQHEIPIVQTVVDPVNIGRFDSIADIKGNEPVDGIREQSVEEIRVNRMKSVNAVETYAKLNFNMDLDRESMNLDQMKTEIIKQIKQREKERETS